MTKSVDPILSDPGSPGVEEALRILVVRPDRLGDVILSTPVMDVIKRYYSKAKLTILVREGVAPLLKGLPFVDELMIFDPSGRHAGIKGFFRLCSEIRLKRFQVAIVLQSHWKIAAALFFVGVKYRVGPLSKIHSYLFYNKGTRQRRSHVEMHEADYNLQLLNTLGISVASRHVPTQVAVSPAVKAQSKHWLEQRGWDERRKMVIVHPGMGGSALNWPESHYIDLIRILLQDGHQVTLTGGPTEGELLDRIQNAIGNNVGKLFIYRNPPENTIEFFAGLCSFANLVVAPSTGPLHVAVAQGAPVLTFYPPIRVQSAVRWGPYLEDESRASVLVPDVYCGQDFKCLGNLCNYFPCMKSLTVKKAVEQVKIQLNGQNSNGKKE